MGKKYMKMNNLKAQKAEQVVGQICLPLLVW